MKVLISGASGLIGRALAAALIASDHEVRRLVRRAAQSPDEFEWDPAKGTIAPEAFAGVDAIVNLAGENVAGGRWTDRRRERIVRSRVDATRTLVAALDKLPSKPRMFLSASAVGFYGDRGDEMLTEKSGIGHGFLPETCLIWETHAEGARRKGVRTVLLRFGVVLAREGGALAKMLPAFRLGLGGRLGGGLQWMSWVALEDAVRAVCFALITEACSGPINVVAPGVVTNGEFTQALGRALNRPTLLPLAAWAIQLGFGEMGRTTLLSSGKVEPRWLTRNGFEFRHPQLEPALKAILG